jgi:hypothetical protein
MIASLLNWLSPFINRIPALAEHRSFTFEVEAKLHITNRYTIAMEVLNLVLDIKEALN